MCVSEEESERERKTEKKKGMVRSKSVLDCVRQIKRQTERIIKKEEERASVRHTGRERKGEKSF